MNILHLDGAWQFRIAGEIKTNAADAFSKIQGLEKNKSARDLQKWIPGIVPGTVHHHLHKQGLIVDPHYSRNELELQWIDQQDWEWRRFIDTTAEDVDSVRQELIFDGLDTVADIFLNDKLVGQSVNMFRQLVCDVKGVLITGRNELRIVLKSPSEYAKKMADKYKHRVADGDWKWQTGEVRLTHRAWIRKTQCHFGWDWGLYLATCGIWQTCRLEIADGPRISAIKISQHHWGMADRPSAVTCELDVFVAGAAKAIKSTTSKQIVASPKSTIHISIREKTTYGPMHPVLFFQVPFALEKSDAKKSKSNFTPTLNATKTGGQSGPIQVTENESMIPIQFTINNPKLWWPAGEGEQQLYEVTVDLMDFEDKIFSTITKQFGLRTAELVRKKDKSPDGQPGESFYFQINGRPIFAKGANWIPADQFVDRCTDDVYKHLLHSMVEANMNMIRVWGGGWYEQEIFYDLCDELGLMVWQDFMMACALYPDTEEFIDEINAEAKYQIGRLQTRASIVLWNGDNEDAEAVWRWWKDSPDFKKNVRIYKKVMTALKKTVEAEDPSRTFWLSSPSNDDFNGDCTNPDRGDVHYWTVWHGKQPFSNYYTVKPRFVSEFGFQSFPEPRTLRECVPAVELNPSSRVMEHHQRSPDGNMLITNTMAREMRIPKDFDMFCWTSQINQAMAIKTAVEHWRRLKPWCMGTLYWQVNDLWPVASWSSIDYHGRWKVLHHEAARFYSPLLSSMVFDGKKLQVWATSDLPRALNLKGQLELYTVQGKRVAAKSLKVNIPAFSSQSIAEFEVGDLLQSKFELHEVIALVSLSDHSIKHENFLNLVPWKWITLPKPKVELELKSTAAGIELHVESDQVIPFFHAELENMEGHFEGDWSMLRPGRKLAMRWMPHQYRGAKNTSLKAAKQSLRTFSLFDTYAV